MSAAKRNARGDFKDVPLPEIRISRRLRLRAPRRRRIVGRRDRRPIPAWLWVYLAMVAVYLCGFLEECGRTMPMHLDAPLNVSTAASRRGD